ncbi:hypothetical protein SAICODRAFT_31117 [Saitoella complicata NRRL Y-17804]|uniref:Uncharacterized protein n=1 Tax=Saitoella complicata (strain BCRC 22490 / CBS 7301 / JCM 7358 / NBRC 10748 / NRRL Y-17804) TaxID=698492 RepID=A0A0E9NL86_SAICN|nr:uncharacterized protein SAICODRAFT_31117 [Saitoella complicata NRRL Y-17804]ODQ51773.1 hypothetical protein SAICODRAFT_31117 [Saitoella complicata NRRL Y-17804]GAO50609.1 hypothetical protein G7K_4733-t1 [Saitoella complicata NRRL Y-17804]
MDREDTKTEEQRPVPWFKALITFCEELGLQETLAGLELDLTLFSPAQEELVAGKVLDLSEQLMLSNTEGSGHALEALEEEAVNAVAKAKKDMKALIREKRERIDESNQNEYLRKRKAVADPTNEDESAARTSAIQIDRSIQMQYDLIRYASGPLERSTFIGSGTTIRHDAKAAILPQTPKAYLESAHNERITNIEQHLNITYAPRPPATLEGRIGAVEKHILRLERDHPPWAALHFRQPGREDKECEATVVKVRFEDAVSREEVRKQKKKGGVKKEKSSGLGLRKTWE